jgi:hypothetical protein
LSASSSVSVIELRGERLYGAAPFGSWNTQTFIAGLTSDSRNRPASPTLRIF